MQTLLKFFILTIILGLSNGNAFCAKSRLLFGNDSSSDSDSSNSQYSEGEWVSGFSSKEPTPFTSPEKKDFTGQQFSPIKKPVHHVDANLDFLEVSNNESTQVVAPIPNAPVYRAHAEASETDIISAVRAHTHDKLQALITQQSIHKIHSSAISEQSFFFIKEDNFQLSSYDALQHFNKNRDVLHTILQKMLDEEAAHITLPFLSIDFMHFIYPAIVLKNIPLNRTQYCAKLSGFHLDYKLRLLDQGLYSLQNIVMVNNEGAYSAEVIMFGANLGLKTFFPAHWSSNTLAQKIVEALSNPITETLKIRTADKTVTIEGQTSGGTRINFIINAEGEITTAFPAPISREDNNVTVARRLVFA